jgi:type I restriction-modification system DNA methylase subunit
MDYKNLKFEAEINDDGEIIDFLSSKLLVNTPEERVRQTYMKILHFDYGYSKDQMAREVGIFYGRKEIVDKQGNPVRADIVVYKNKKSCSSRDQGNILFIVECKAPKETDGYNQLVSYIFNTSAHGGIWFNGSGDENEVAYFRRLFEPENQLVPWPQIPRNGEAWDAIGRQKKSQLRKPKDIKGLLRRCHNKLHSRGTEDDDLTMDMVRIILAKATDEEHESDLPQFYCTPEEYNTEEGIRNVEERIQKLFDEVKQLNPQVFGEHERITVGARAIADVVSELQEYQLLSDLKDSDGWDIMGHAYEQYTATYLKRKNGQFFTNRLAIDFLTQLLSPSPNDIILDPAGGSGGFLTGVLRFVRHNILDGEGSEISKQRQLDRHRTRLFMVEISNRLVKVAKTAMILNGDGHTGMTQGDSLGPFSQFNETILAQCNKGKPTIILTNPPFAGVGEGRITQKDTLERFKLGKVWKENRNNTLEPTDTIISDGVPPEMLFFERCIEWLSEGGKLGIVMPKGFLDTATYQPARQYLFNECKLLAVVNCHKNTFQPYTGVRTTLIIVQKFAKGESKNKDYKIFMAISKKIGQDSEGKPIYKINEEGKPTDQLDHDLDEISSDYKKNISGNFQNSEFRFQINKSQIDTNLKINPQAHMPTLNATLKSIENLDSDLWDVVQISQVVPDTKVFKGPRLKSENLIVEKIDNETTEIYYPPTAILQGKSESFKYLDLSKASKKQLETIEKLRVHKGDIVITRSGSIGRVALITGQHDGVIASDDLIRVIIPDEKIRLFVFFYLQSKYAQDQMKINEYGSIQQHLEPIHISVLLIPLPNKLKLINNFQEHAKNYLINLEKAQEERDEATKILDDVFDNATE